jgi:hypothetical protein
MNNALNVAKLDFLTVNALVTRRAIIIFLVLVIAFSVLGSGGEITAMSLCITIMMSVAIIAYPFTVGEKNNIDSLFGVLGTDRETVVLGRYIFTIVTDVVAISAAIIINLIDLGVYTLLGKNYDLSVFPMLILTLASGSVFFEIISLPIYFGKPYAKAKFSIWFVYCLFGLFVGFLMGTLGDGSFEEILRALGGLYPSDIVAVLINLVFLGVGMIISYLISVRNYKKREF